MQSFTSYQCKHHLMLIALAVTAFCLSGAQRAVAADTNERTDAVFIQPTASFTEGLGYTHKVSNRTSREHQIGQRKSRSASGNRQSRGGKGRFKRRSLLRTGFLFTGFGAGYIGLDGTSLTLDNSTDDDLNPRGVRLRLGTPIDNVFDLEIHVGGGRDSQTSAADKISATYVGAFVKGHVPLGSRSALFGLIGVSGVNINQSTGDREFSDSRGGFSYGFGLETTLSDRVDLSGDFVRYVGEDGEFSPVSAVNLGIKLYF